MGSRQPFQEGVAPPWGNRYRPTPGRTRADLRIGKEGGLDGGFWGNGYRSTLGWTRADLRIEKERGLDGVSAFKRPPMSPCRGGNIHRLFHYPTLGLGAIKKQKKEGPRDQERARCGWGCWPCCRHTPTVGSKGGGGGGAGT